MTSYISIEKAIGNLVLGGIIPVLVKFETGGAGLYCKFSDQYICRCHRDGATYRVAEIEIHDALEDSSQYASCETIINR